MIDKNEWLDRIEEFLEEISDVEFQERVWVRGEGPEVSSYSDLMCGLFDDFSFDAFLDESWGQFDLSETLHEELLRIRSQLNQFDPGNPMNSEKIVNDPMWGQIRRDCLIILNHFRAERASI